MPEKIYFSIVIPTFNSEKTIEETITSVLNQNYKNYEIIIVDNNSSDNTMQILDNFKTTNINIYKIKNNGIIAKSRNFGVQKSKYEWICFLDSDDIWLDNKLNHLNSLILNNKNFDIFAHKEFINYKQKKIVKKIRYKYDKNIKFLDNIINENFLSPSAVCIKRESLITLNLYYNESKKFVTAEDYHFWITLALSKFKLYFSNEYLGVYNINTNNFSLNTSLHNQNIKNVLFDFLNKSNDIYNEKILYKINILELKSNFYNKNYLNLIFIFFKKILLKKFFFQNIIYYLIYKKK